MQSKSLFLRFSVALVLPLLMTLGGCKSRSFERSLGQMQSSHDGLSIDCSQSQVLERNAAGEMGLRVQDFQGGGPYTIRMIKAETKGLTAQELIYDGQESRFERGRALFRRCYQPALDFVFDLYKTRRGWNDAFLEKLRVAARQYELASEYVLVFENADEGQSRLVGSIRFISMPYITYTHRVGGVIDGTQQVTTETKVFTAWDLLKLNRKDLESFVSSDQSHSKEILGDQLGVLLGALKEAKTSDQAILPLESIGFKAKTGVGDARCQSYEMSAMKTGHHCLSAGEVIEPGNLGIQKDRNREILTIFVRAILLRMMRNDLALPSIISNRIMSTYNDKTPLYTRLGFVEAPPALERYGINWTLLVADMSRFLGHYRTTLQTMTDLEGNAPLSKIQETLANLGWQKNLKERMAESSREDHLKFLQNLYRSLESSQNSKTGTREVCGLLSVGGAGAKSPRGAGWSPSDQNSTEKDWSLTELFSNESYSLEFGDGATINHLEHHWEKGIPVCVTAFVGAGQTLSVRSVNYQRTW